MKLSRHILALVFLAVTLGSSFAAPPTEYRGLCEASAVAFIDATHFAMASDETNTLQLYEFGKPDPIGKGVNFEEFTTFDKSDLEGAAAIGKSDLLDFMPFVQQRWGRQEEAQGSLRS